MNATVQKWGNSLALRIPGPLAKDIHLHQGSVVDISVVEGKMVVKSKGHRKYSLPQMLAKVTKANRQREEGWGPAQGKETW